TRWVVSGMSVITRRRVLRRRLNRVRVDVSGTFLLTMIIAALVGILLLVVAAYYSSLNASVLPKWFVGLIRDVGTAVLVAVITAVTIELFVNARVRREIGEDVFQATFRRFLPDVLYWQVKDHILQSPVLRRDWSVQLQVLDRASNAPLYDEARRLGGDDIYLVEYKVSYRL